MQFDKNDSPFIALPSPLSNIILTPKRLTDVEAALECLNDPAVYNNLVGPPFPYTHKNFEEWHNILSKVNADALREYMEMQDSPGEKWVGQLPISAIREVDAKTGAENFIGEITLRRRGYQTTSNVTERTRLRDENAARKAGDPKIDWTLGFYLSPAHSGRGIMSAVVHTVLHAFMVPYMNAHRLTCAFFEHNVASRRVFEKNGFTLIGWYPEIVEMSENKTGVKGKKVGLGVLEWEKEPVLK